MKTITLFITPFLLLAGIPSRSTKANLYAYSYANDFDYLLVPAFKKGRTIKIPYKVSFTNTQKKTVTLTGKYSVSSEYQTIASFTVSNTTSKQGTLSFTNPFNEEIYDIDLKFTIKTTKMKIKEIDVVAKTYDRRSINNTNIVNNAFTSSDCIYIYDHINGGAYYHETYSFDYVNNSYELDQTHIFDPTKFKFRYDPVGLETFTCETMYLFINNYDGIFSDLTIESGTAKIPLKMKKTSSTYSFSLLNTYYVNPLTLKMSESPKEGYVQTDKFYFPKEVAGYLDKLYASFYFGDMGLAKNGSSISYRLSLDVDTLGLCGIGGYCINSQSGTPDFEIGETFTHD